jgi:hypothetical protein
MWGFHSNPSSEGAERTYLEIENLTMVPCWFDSSDWFRFHPRKRIIRGCFVRTVIDDDFCVVAETVCVVPQLIDFDATRIQHRIA